MLLVLLALITAALSLKYGLRLLKPALPATTLRNPAIFADSRARALGSATATVVIYLLSDYACPNCRAMHEDLRQLVADDGKVRIVYRDLPILGERSIRAARLVIASAARGSHTRFDDELMRRGGPLDERSLHAAAARAGITTLSG